MTHWKFTSSPSNKEFFHFGDHTGAIVVDTSPGRRFTENSQSNFQKGIDIFKEMSYNIYTKEREVSEWNAKSTSTVTALGLTFMV